MKSSSMVFTPSELTWRPMRLSDPVAAYLAMPSMQK